MANQPHVVIASSSPAERAQLKFYFSSAEAGCTVEEAGAGLTAQKPPKLVVFEVEPGETLAGAAARVQKIFPRASLVGLLDAPPPMRAASGEPEPALDGVVIRPLSLERLDSVLHAALERAAIPERPRVLVVDDDPEVLHFVEQVLGKAGCDVTAVSDARRYLARPRQPGFDLALLDVVMPEVDGLQLCLRLRAATGDSLRICMMSAAHDPETERKADLYGADEFIPKPLHVRELRALVGRARAHPGKSLLGQGQLRAVPGGK